MTFYTLRAAANKLGVSHETIRKRLQVLISEGLELPSLKIDNRQQWEIIPEELLSHLRETQKRPNK